jgi:integrase
MTTRKTLTDRGVAALRPRATRYAHPDPELRGMYVRITPGGHKSFVAVARADGKQVWITIGPADVMPIAEARERAREIVRRVRAGLPAIEARGETVAQVAAAWIRRHVEKNGLRSGKVIVRMIGRHVLPAWGGRAFTSLRRGDIATLIDGVEDRHGARQADIVLSLISGVMSWYATRHDDFRPPIVRGVRRQSPHAQRRSRVLDDDEIRALWLAAGGAGSFGAAVKLLLLTAQRRAKVVGMKWDDVSPAGQWTIPREAREKGNAGVLGLPEAALAVIRSQPRFAGNPRVFAAGRGRGPIADMTNAKARFDAAAGVTGWRLHDLRRTARSLMARAGVPREVAEQVLGHALPNIEATYNVFHYRDEKAAALARLAALIGGIVHPRANVVPLAKK